MDAVFPCFAVAGGGNVPGNVPLLGGQDGHLCPSVLIYSIYMMVHEGQAPALGQRGVRFAAEHLQQPRCDVLRLWLSDSVCAHSLKLDQLNFK